MRKEFITATEVRGTETYSTIYAFNICDESIDLQEAVKKAAAAYINTDAGYKVYQHNCQCFNWGDFFLYVTNSFLKLFGFEKEFSDITQADVNFNEQLACEEDLKFSDEKWNILKKTLFINGPEGLADFIGKYLILSFFILKKKTGGNFKWMHLKSFMRTCLKGS